MEQFVRSFMIETNVSLPLPRSHRRFYISAAEMFSDYLRVADDASDASSASMLEEVSQCFSNPLVQGLNFQLAKGQENPPKDRCTWPGQEQDFCPSYDGVSEGRSKCSPCKLSLQVLLEFGIHDYWFR